MTEPVPSLPPPRLDDITQDALHAYFENTWALYEALFSSLDAGALCLQPDPLRHPLVFYAGHTAAFYINKLRLAGLLAAGIDPALDVLFAQGVDPHTAAELMHSDAWPDAETTHRYRARAREAVLRVIDALPPAGVVTAQHPVWALLMGLEHDRIHLETSSVLIRQVDAARLTRPAGWHLGPRGGEPPPIVWRTRGAQRVSLGRPAGGGGLFGWDNEFGHATRTVAPFQATAHLISNRAFHAFWLDGGYQDARLWSAEGWAWRSTHGVTRPRFWTEDGRYRAMFEVIDMPWGWPVEVNAHEAWAFCRWLGEGARLPTEAEHLALTQDAPLHSDGDVIQHPDYSLNLRYTSPCPVDHLPPTPSGIYDAYGNVWEWLGDDFAPLPGFAPHPLYADFSAPYFDDAHSTLRGGAWATTGTSASRFYRLWFRRHFYQHAGFRVVRPAAG